MLARATRRIRTIPTSITRVSRGVAAAAGAITGNRILDEYQACLRASESHLAQAFTHWMRGDDARALAHFQLVGAWTATSERLESARKWDRQRALVSAFDRETLSFLMRVGSSKAKTAGVTEPTLEPSRVVLDLALIAKSWEGHVAWSHGLGTEAREAFHTTRQLAKSISGLPHDFLPLRESWIQARADRPLVGVTSEDSVALELVMDHTDVWTWLEDDVRASNASKWSSAIFFDDSCAFEHVLPAFFFRNAIQHVVCHGSRAQCDLDTFRKHWTKGRECDEGMSRFPKRFLEAQALRELISSRWEMHQEDPQWTNTPLATMAPLASASQSPLCLLVRAWTLRAIPSNALPWLVEAERIIRASVATKHATFVPSDEWSDATTEGAFFALDIVDVMRKVVRRDSDALPSVRALQSSTRSVRAPLLYLLLARHIADRAKHL